MSAVRRTYELQTLRESGQNRRVSVLFTKLEYHANSLVVYLISSLECFSSGFCFVSEVEDVTFTFQHQVVTTQWLLSTFDQIDEDTTVNSRALYLSKATVHSLTARSTPLYRDPFSEQPPLQLVFDLKRSAKLFLKLCVAEPESAITEESVPSFLRSSYEGPHPRWRLRHATKTSDALRTQASG
jgi:hypothetical protein